MFFESPDDLFDSSFEIPRATTTKVINSNSGFDVATFDALEDGEGLKDLVIEDDDNVVGTLDFPLIMLFENAEGRKGAIKLILANQDRLLANIKVQKY